jgi:putative transposase
VKRLKGAPARAIVERYPEVKRESWGGKLWVVGYFAHPGGDVVTKNSIKEYLKCHKDHEGTPKQLALH